MVGLINDPGWWVGYGLGSLIPISDGGSCQGVWGSRSMKWLRSYNIMRCFSWMFGKFVKLGDGDEWWALLACFVCCEAALCNCSLPSRHRKLYPWCLLSPPAYKKASIKKKYQNLRPETSAIVPSIFSRLRQFLKRCYSFAKHLFVHGGFRGVGKPPSN